MRKITTALMAITVAGAMAAETTDASGGVQWGIKAAFDINIPGNWHANGSSVKMYKSGCGFTLGGVCNIPLRGNFYLEPGLSFFYDTYAYDDLRVMGDDLQAIQTDPSLYKVGLRLPVVVGYDFNISDRLTMTVFTGPELSYALGGEVRLKDEENLDFFDKSLFGENAQRRFDCAWKIGFGLFPTDNFLISIDGAIGMTDLQKSAVSFRENRMSIGATYFF